MAITNARMQIKRGNEVDFDAEKMLVGEWALSTDKRIVRICVAPNVCIRMATYDAFEVDMAQIEKILEECQTIEDAVKLINSQVSEKLQATIEYTNQAKQYRDETEQFRNEVESMVDIGIATTERAGIVKPDGVTIRVDEDGTIHADNGTVDYNELENKPSINGMELSGDKSLDELGIASVEALEETNSKVNIIIEKAELNIKNSASGENLHLTDSANGTNVGFGLYGKAEQNGEPTPDNPIEITVSGSDGSVEVVTENEDSTQSTTAIIPTPDGLCGIKVSSGGNYTDENGQQWICDEVVKYADGSGKRIQRIGKKIIESSTTFNLSNQTEDGVYTFGSLSNWLSDRLNSNDAKAVCTHVCFGGNKVSGSEIYSAGAEVICFIRSNTYNTVYINTKKATTTQEFHALFDGAEVYYILAEPIITDITAEEIAEIEKLHTFYPITNISNDAECGMSITYMADAKNYIDNRLALIESAMLNNI